MVNDTFQHDLSVITKPCSRTHGVAEPALDRREEDGFTRRSLAVSRPSIRALGRKHRNDTYAVARTEYDQFESEQLRDLIFDLEEAPDSLAEEPVCQACRSTYDTLTEECTQCDSNVPLKRRKLAVLDSVTSYRDDLATSTGGGFEARDLYQGDDEVQSTFADRDSQVLSFDVDDKFELTDDHGVPMGTLEYGSIDVLVHATSYRAKYTSGAIDPRETLFERCGHDACPGVIARDHDDGTARCTVDAKHDPDGYDDMSEFVRLGCAYSTEGLRMRLSETIENSQEATHALTHGFRVALQYLGGVDVREITESVEDDMVDLFDSQEGGAQITRLVVQRDATVSRNFREAVDLMNTHFECDCEDGCPLCVYQYGCDTYNETSTLAKEELLDLMEDEIKIREVGS